MRSLIQFDFSLIRCNPMTIAWNLWRHRCERRLKKTSQTVVRTWFRLWYYLYCIWFHSDLLDFPYLGIASGIDMDQSDCVYTRRRSYLHQVHGLLSMQRDWVPHISSISSKIPPNHSSSPICSLMNHTICDNHTSRSFRKACAEWTCDSHRVIASLASVILVVRPLSTLPVFSFLHGTLSASLLLTWRVSILGKDNELPRKSGVAGTVGSGTGSMVFDVDATGWSGRIHITAPVEWTTIGLAADDAHNDITHLGPSPLYPPPSCPFSSQSTPTTCCTWPWLLCTHCTFIQVVRCMAACSSRTIHTWSCVHWVRIHLARVARLPLHCRHCHCYSRGPPYSIFSFLSRRLHHA